MVILCGNRPFWVRLGKIARAERSHRLAQANSIARMANPAGITMNAGPGNTIIAIPRISTVPPSATIIMRLKCFIVDYGLFVQSAALPGGERKRNRVATVHLSAKVCRI